MFIPKGSGFKCITKKTMFQAFVIGLILGPAVWLFEGEPYTIGNLIWAFFGFFMGPIVADFLRPQVTVEKEMECPKQNKS